jgi:hypothetical protein
LWLSAGGIPVAGLKGPDLEPEEMENVDVEEG